MTKIDVIKLCLIHCIKQFLVFHLMKTGLMVKKQNKRIGGAKVPNSDIKTFNYMFLGVAIDWNGRRR